MTVRCNKAVTIVRHGSSIEIISNISYGTVNPWRAMQQWKRANKWNKQTTKTWNFNPFNDLCYKL